MKVLTPTMAKMSQKMTHTRNTLKMEGNAPTSAFTTTLKIVFIKLWVPEKFTIKYPLPLSKNVGLFYYILIGWS